MENKIVQFSEMIQNSNNIVFFGGAGVSTESGIPDFRSSDGIYSKKIGKHIVTEDALSVKFKNAHPNEFFEFYANNLLYPEIKPNEGHYALAKLEKAGKLKAIITQNVDGLHQKAGSHTVYEIHGSADRNYCRECGNNFNSAYMKTAILNSKDKIPRCKYCGGIIDPDVTLYGESLDMYIYGEAISAISKADLFIIGGTSLTVHPACYLIYCFHNKNNYVIINKSETDFDNSCALVIREPIGKTLKEAIDIALS